MSGLTIPVDRRTTVGIITAFAVAAVMVVPALADAARVGVAGTTVRYAAGAQETNEVAVSYEYATATLTFIESGPDVSLAAGNGCISVDATTATCAQPADPFKAFASLAVITGTGDDEIDLEPSVTYSSKLNGGPGDDLIVGGPSDELLIGGPGGDSLDGGGGPDRFVAGSGDDAIDSRGGAESVNCGGMTDSVFATQSQILAGKIIKRNCENVFSL